MQPRIAQPGTPVKLPEITSRVEVGGFLDLIFAIESVKYEPNGAISLVCAGRHGGKILRFQVIVSGTPGGAAGVLKAERAAVCSTGPESDAFVQALGSLYKVKVVPQKMRAKTNFTCFPLNQWLTIEVPCNFKKEHVYMKLFSDKASGKDFSEVYFNVDIPKKEVELNEKDPEYRTPLIKALTQ